MVFIKHVLNNVTCTLVIFWLVGWMIQMLGEKRVLGEIIKTRPLCTWIGLSLSSLIFPLIDRSPLSLLTISLFDAWSRSATKTKNEGKKKKLAEAALIVSSENKSKIRRRYVKRRKKKTKKKEEERKRKRGNYKKNYSKTM